MAGVYRRPPMAAATRLRARWPPPGRSSACGSAANAWSCALPTDDDLLDLIAVAKAGIHPPDEMPFGVAWSTIPSPAFERSFLQYHWGHRRSGRPTTGS